MMMASTQPWSAVAETSSSVIAANRMEKQRPLNRPQQHAIDTVAQTMQGEKVHFLNSGGLRVRYADMHVFRREQLFRSRPTAAGEGDHAHLALVGSRDGASHVF